MSDNTVAWFEVATDDPDGAERFYGGLFGWTFSAHGDDYRMISNASGGDPVGGLFDSKGDFPAHAVFHVKVADVEETCGRIESLGGKVLRKELGGGTDFAYVHDPSGNMFGIFHPRS